MEKEIIERCGFCGAYIKNGQYMTAEECKEADAKGELENLGMGYCPNAQGEYYNQNPETYSFQEN